MLWPFQCTPIWPVSMSVPVLVCYLTSRKKCISMKGGNTKSCKTDWGIIESHLDCVWQNYWLTYQRIWEEEKQETPFFHTLDATSLHQREKTKARKAMMLQQSSYLTTQNLQKETAISLCTHVLSFLLVWISNFWKEEIRFEDMKPRQYSALTEVLHFKFKHVRCL